MFSLCYLHIECNLSSFHRMMDRYNYLQRPERPNFELFQKINTDTQGRGKERKLAMSSDFVEVILPSTNMPVKPYYTLAEAAKILDVSIDTVRRYGKNYENQTGRARLKIEADKTVLYSTFEKLFSHSILLGGKEYKP